jgi:Ca2+-binding EF-hand superfamily protein
MKNFMEATNFKKATLTYLASTLPERYFEDLRKIFISMDLNGDGKIDSFEFKSALTSVGLEFSKEDIDKLIN